MTEESAKGKLTLSKKSTLTLKNVNKPAASDGKKVVQVEVRKKRVVNSNQPKVAPKVEIDEATAQKLKLLAEAKEYEANVQRKKPRKKPLKNRKKKKRPELRLSKKKRKKKNRKRLRQTKKFKRVSIMFSR